MGNVLQTCARFLPILPQGRHARARARANLQQHSWNIFWLNKKKQPKRRYLSWRQIPKNTKNRTSVVKTWKYLKMWPRASKKIVIPACLFFVIFHRKITLNCNSYWSFKNICFFCPFFLLELSKSWPHKNINKNRDPQKNFLPHRNARVPERAAPRALREGGHVSAFTQVVCYCMLCYVMLCYVMLVGSEKRLCYVMLC